MGLICLVRPNGVTFGILRIVHRRQEVLRSLLFVLILNPDPHDQLRKSSERIDLHLHRLLWHTALNIAEYALIQEVTHRWLRRISPTDQLTTQHEGKDVPAPSSRTTSQTGRKSQLDLRLAATGRSTVVDGIHQVRDLPTNLVSFCPCQEVGNHGALARTLLHAEHQLANFEGNRISFVIKKCFTRIRILLGPPSLEESVLIFFGVGARL